MAPQHGVLCCACACVMSLSTTIGVPDTIFLHQTCNTMMQSGDLLANWAQVVNQANGPKASEAVHAPAPVSPHVPPSHPQLMRVRSAMTSTRRPRTSSPSASPPARTGRGSSSSAPSSVSSCPPTRAPASSPSWTWSTRSSGVVRPLAARPPAFRSCVPQLTSSPSDGFLLWPNRERLWRERHDPQHRRHQRVLRVIQTLHLTLHGLWGGESECVF